MLAWAHVQADLHLSCVDLPFCCCYHIGLKFLLFSLTVTVPLAKKFSLDYRLIAAPDFAATYMETFHKVCTFRCNAELFTRYVGVLNFM